MSPSPERKGLRDVSVTQLYTRKWVVSEYGPKPSYLYFAAFMENISGVFEWTWPECFSDNTVSKSVNTTDNVKVNDEEPGARAAG